VINMSTDHQKRQIRGGHSRFPNLCSMALILVSLIGVRVDASGESADFSAGFKAEAQAALQYYINLDCGVESATKTWPPTALERLLRIAQDEPEVEKGLIGFLQSGLDTDKAKAMSSALEDEWSNLKNFLDQKSDFGLQSDYIRIAQNLIERKETYIAQGLARIQKKYRERSAFALLLLANRGSTTAEDALREIMKKGDTDSQNAIAKARKRLALVSPQPERFASSGNNYTKQ
jgi:hypothetical protein